MYEECIADCARDEVTRMFKPVNFTKTQPIKALPFDDTLNEKLMQEPLD